MHLIPPPGDIDVLAIGETVIDLISIEPAESLREAEQFQRYRGGSPANIATNITRLGGYGALISKIGADPLGRYAADDLGMAGINTDYLVQDPAHHTSVILVTRSTGTPDFAAYRDADVALRPDEINPEAITRSRVVHASTFALSRQPCRSAIIHAFHLAHRGGKWTSLDPNYRAMLWPDRDEALEVLGNLYPMTTLTKPSLDDAIALFGQTLSPETALARFHELGASLIILTMGGEGALISDQERVIHLPARPVEIQDATGAGDAFWAGFLLALLDGYGPDEAALVAREIVERKIQTVGPSLQPLDRRTLYHTLQLGERPGKEVAQSQTPSNN